MEPTNDPEHPANRYPWNRKGTNVREALEHFLWLAGKLPDADQGERRGALAWLLSLLDKKPEDLFP